MLWAEHRMPRERFSLEELAHLYSVLLKHSVVNDSNRDILVETLRSIAELMIWGDQHEPKFFEFFLEKQLLAQFHRILSQPGSKRGDIAQQVLQTLSIMIQNIRNETSIYFLFSNNQINSMLAIKLDFNDEEVMGYYISFLKAIALKFNEQTVQLFLNMDNDNPKLPRSFPLYTEALKFFRHKESMVRAGVRTLTLSVYSIRDELVRNFILSPPASGYFRHIAMYLTEQCQLLDGTLMSAEAGQSKTLSNSLDNVLAEVEDAIVYTNDVLCAGCAGVGKAMATNMWQHFLVPCCFAPLAKGMCADKEKTDVVSTWVGEYQAAIRPVCALYVAERVFALMSDERLVNSLACALLGVDTQVRQAGKSSWAAGDLVAPKVSRKKGEAGWMDYRSAILKALDGSDCQVSGAGIRLLFALLQSQVLDISVMDSAGLLPSRRRKRRDLFNSLTKKSTMFEEEEAANSDSAALNPGPVEDGSHGTEAVEILDVLLRLLRVQGLPASVMWHTGWILGQLIPVEQRGTQQKRVLTQDQQKLLMEARSLCHEESMDEVAGLWCDALPMLITAEWPAARAGITAPTLKSHSDSVLAWLAANSAQTKKLQGETARAMYTQPQAQTQLSISARAAACTTTTVQRLVALVQIRQLLDTGEISVTAPLPEAADVTQMTRRADVREGAQVDLAGPGPSAVPCKVAFSRGVERAVYFAINGGVLPEDDSQDSALLKLSPVVLLADPATTRLNAGTVLSTAPLLGADPAVDGSHPHWLHLHVRPPIRGLVKALKLGQPGTSGLSALSALGGQAILSGRHLQDGHWVISFPDGEAAANAKAVVEERAAGFRGRYCQLISALLYAEPPAGSSSKAPP